MVDDALQNLYPKIRNSKNYKKVRYTHLIKKLEQNFYIKVDSIHHFSIGRYIYNEIDI